MPILTKIRPPSGSVRLLKIDGGVCSPLTRWRRNLVLYDWAAIVATLLATGASSHKIGGMYVEFENVADPEDAVAVPSYGRADGRSYYDGLDSDPARDYLRVPLSSALVSSSDLDLYPASNQIRFFAQTGGLEGVHGKPFSNAVNSKICGFALASFVDEDDPTRDLCFSRFYLDPSEQQVKGETSQYGVDWLIRLA